MLLGVAEENAQLRHKLDHMNELLLNAQRTRFGPSSESTKYVMQGGTQLGLFNEAEAEQDHKAVEPTENTIVIPEHTRKAKRTVDELTANLPVKKVLITLSDDELICDKCGGKDEAFSGIRVYCGKCDDAKVCGRTAFGPARKDLGTRGDLPFPCHDVQLGDPVRADLAETTVPAHEKDSFGVFRNSCRRDCGAGAEGGGKGRHERVSYVGVCQQ